MATDPNWPVWLYVGAWLLPLISFILLVLGGKHWGRAAAYVALAAIVGSFGLSAYGLFVYANQFSPNFFQDAHGDSHAHDSHASHNGEDETTGAGRVALISTVTLLQANLQTDSTGTATQEGSAQTPAAANPAQQPPPGDQQSPGMVPMRPTAVDAPAPGPLPPPTSPGAMQPGGMQGAAPTYEPVEPGVWKKSFKWMSISSRHLRMGFYVDSLTVVMFFMVTLVASLIHLFSMEYMHEELHDPVHDPLAVEPGEPPLHRSGRFPRFFTYLSLFCFSMLGLVIADNAFMVFMFWEAVGICSYLLIGFYYERKSATTAANKAFIVNRVGDAGFIVGLMILWTSMGTFNIQDVSRIVRDGSGRMVRLDEATGNTLYWDDGHRVWIPEGAAVQDAAKYTPGEVRLYNPIGSPRGQVAHGLPAKMTYGLLTLAGIGIFIGCVGKSAQFPLHVWLPDAMEGPTPVSALIHAATMVAAGVYFVGRFYALFTPHALLVIAYTGGITLFLAGTIALVMTDIKKVLAYSTVSQLGYMMLGLGVGGWAAGLFHLITHAFFKALLFLGSGSVIHGTGTQEMPKMGGLWRKMPITAVTMLVGVLAISGIPLFSGFYSKDAIVVQALYFWQGWGDVPGNPQHFLLFMLPTAGAAITAFYMFRLFFMTFAGEPRDHHIAEHAHESKWVMWLPLVILAVPSVVVGYGWNGSTPLLERMFMFRPAFVGHLAHVPHEVHEFGGMVALIAVLFGILMALLFYGESLFGFLFFFRYLRVLDPAEVARQFPRVYDFLMHKWYFDELYDRAFVRPAVAFARTCRSFDWIVLDGIIDRSARATVWWSRVDGWFDNRIIDGIVNWISDWVYGTGNWLRRLQTGQLRQYVMFLAVAAVGLFAVMSFLGADILKTFLVK